MSRRLYLTLNSDKEKDRIIEEFLSNYYNEKDVIKEILYRCATNSTFEVQNVPLLNSNKSKNNDIKGIKCTEEVQISPKSEYSIKEEMHLKGANSNEYEDNEIRNNEIYQLKEFL